MDRRRYTSKLQVKLMLYTNVIILLKTDRKLFKNRNTNANRDNQFTSQKKNVMLNLRLRQYSIYLVLNQDGTKEKKQKQISAI